MAKRDDLHKVVSTVLDISREAELKPSHILSLQILK